MKKHRTKIKNEKTVELHRQQAAKEDPKGREAGNIAESEGERHAPYKRTKPDTLALGCNTEQGRC